MRRSFFIAVFLLSTLCLFVNADSHKLEPKAKNKLFIESARVNKDQLFNMEWDFAGTRQKGVYLYVELISEMIEVSAPIDSLEFAAALAAWQDKHGFAATGRLDKESWCRMVEMLQDDRLKSREYPSMNELVTAPVSDFFDPARPEDLRRVQRKTYEAYKRMTEEARAD